MKVFIICFCDNLELKQSALLTLQYIRVGFPTTKDIVCIWTGGLENVKFKVIELCSYNNVTFTEYQTTATNDMVIKDIINRGLKKVLILDSDVIFWDNCEGYEPIENITGRFIPKHYCRYSKTIAMPRIHPSFVWITDCGKLINDIAMVSPAAKRFTKYDAISPTSVFVNGKCFFFDTFANLPVVCGKFDVNMLNKYDHLFCGSYANDVDKSLAGFLDYHKAIYVNHSLAKGIWKKQDEYFNNSRQ